MNKNARDISVGIPISKPADSLSLSLQAQLKKVRIQIATFFHFDI